MKNLYFIEIYYLDKNGYRGSVYTVLKEFTTSELLEYCETRQIKNIKKL